MGQPASFEEKDEHPSAVEYLLCALAGALSTGFATECAKDGIEIDDIEISIKGKLDNVLAHLGIEEGDPSFKSIELKCFASTMDDTEKVLAATRAFGDLEGGLDFWHPADCIGDAGAALGILDVIWGATAMRRGYSPNARVIVWGASENGVRGAVVLEHPTG